MVKFLVGFTAGILFVATLIFFEVASEMSDSFEPEPPEEDRWVFV